MSQNISQPLLKVLLIDNYDSFTYNLVQYFQTLNLEVIVKRNDEISTKEALEINPDYLVFSPGPGTVENPDDIGVGPELFNLFQNKIPILGVCLGQQMIGHILGGKIVKVPPKHGKRWNMKVLDKSGLFSDFPDNFLGMRYHSMIVSKENFPHEELTITVETEDTGCIMAFENKEKMIYGVQFHPESIGTPEGINILKNFISIK